MVAAVIPCYKVKKHILPLLAKIGPEVSAIYVVDDRCPEGTGEYVRQTHTDSRVKVLFNPTNLGVGGAMIAGFKRALTDGFHIIIKIDGDGQMDPALVPLFIKPIADGLADYTKGNRFFNLESLQEMPAIRIIGNSGLSFLAKLTTGYWNVMDPTNGYFAIHRKALEVIPLEKISRDYFFETDMLFRLNTIRAVVKDIPIKAIYADEKSNLRIPKICVQFPPKFTNRFFKRIFYNYFLRDFNVATIEGLIGLPLMLYGLAYGIMNWVRYSQMDSYTPTGTVMLASLPIILGFQLLLSAINYDIMNVPKDPIQRGFSN